MTQIKTKWTVKPWREPVHYKYGMCVVYSREMNQVMTMLLSLWLIFGFVLGQELDVSFSEESQLLQPNGKVTGIDNVGVAAKHAELTEPIELTIERIDNPASLTPFPATTKAKPITGFYQVRSPKQHFIYPGQLTITIPHPEGAPKEGLAVAFLERGGEDSANDDEYQWYFSQATYAPATNEIIFGLKYAGPEGMPFVIVSGRYYVPQ